MALALLLEVGILTSFNIMFDTPSCPVDDLALRLCAGAANLSPPPFDSSTST